VPSEPIRFRPGILATRILVALGGAPMLLVTLVFVRSIGTECIPGVRAGTVGSELTGAAAAWVVYLLPAIGAYVLSRGAPPIWKVFLALSLALLGVGAAMMMVPFVALAHLC
jgi:hypothetical protein